MKYYKLGTSELYPLTGRLVMTNRQSPYFENSELIISDFLFIYLYIAHFDCFICSLSSEILFFLLAFCMLDGTNMHIVGCQGQ